jgi:hypothetical protein
MVCREVLIPLMFSFFQSFFITDKNFIAINPFLNLRYF